MGRRIRGRYAGTSFCDGFHPKKNRAKSGKTGVYRDGNRDWIPNAGAWSRKIKIILDDKRGCKSSSKDLHPLFSHTIFTPYVWSHNFFTHSEKSHRILTAGEPIPTPFPTFSLTIIPTPYGITAPSALTCFIWSMTFPYEKSTRDFSPCAFLFLRSIFIKRSS